MRDRTYLTDAGEHAARRRQRPNESSDWIALVREQVGSLSFGQVLITVHDGRVVQVERTERIRIEAGPRTVDGS